jgi:hypothetical protein
MWLQQAKHKPIVDLNPTQRVLARKTSPTWWKALDARKGIKPLIRSDEAVSLACRIGVEYVLETP